MASKNLEVSLLLDCYSELLTEKQRNLLQFYYNDDLSLSEIAENEGITRQGVRDIVKRAADQLFDLEDKLRLYHNGIENSERLAEISRLANDILTDNCDNIKKAAEKIKMLALDE